MNKAITETPSLSRLGLDRSSRVLVVGLGSTGLSVARFLSNRGIQLAVADTRANPPGLAELRECLPDVAVFLGGFDAAAFARATHLVVSPGVALETPAVRQAIRLGLPVFGDLDLFACMAQAPVIGITGANGKSTVTTLLGLMAEASQRKAKVGGNLGTPMLDLLDAEAELYVLELSSFQLERSSLLEAEAATVLNISPDHLDRYPDIQAYADAKRRIFKGQGLMVLNADDAMVEAMAEEGRRCVRFSLQETADAEYRLSRVDGQEWLVCGGEPLMPVAEIRLKGRHNVANALAAAASCLALGVDFGQIAEGLSRLAPVAGRIQPERAKNGALLINDTYNANPSSFKAALDVLLAVSGEPWVALGAFGELGETSAALHAELGALAKAAGVARLFATGPNADQAVETFGPGARFFSRQEELIEQLQEELREDVALLVKGSRSQRMERVIEALRARTETCC